MALAIRSAALGRNTWTYLLLLATAFIGLVFLGIKFTEYYQHYQMHKAPGVWFESNSPDAGAIELFYVFYFAMTGLHAVHMTIGIGLVVLFAFRTAAGSFNSQYHTPLEALGLYWHFVDIVWVFLFAIFYISGLHKS
jgi:cytochrome c oxidase subunit 3